jgi:hypothetical protein
MDATLPREITLSEGVDSSQVWVFPRADPADPERPWVLHLVNRDLQIDGEDDAVQEHEEFRLRVSTHLFGGVPLRAIYHDPSGLDVDLPLTDDGDGYSFVIPALHSYGLVELSPTGDAAGAESALEYESPWETFDDSESPGFAVYLDQPGPDNEAIHRFSSDWAWGGMSTNTDWGPIAQNTDWGGLVQFQNGAKQGARIYTRFDQHTEPPGEGADQPDAIYDLTTEGATLALGIAMTLESQDWALLIRDDAGWWQSSPITVPELSWDTGRVRYIPISELSWTAVDSAAAGAMDMDQVDAGGEQVLALDVRTDPNLALVEGLGLVALEDGHEQWSLNFIGLALVQAVEPED